MAFDISRGESAPPVEPPADFDEFHSVHAESIARSLSLACGDETLAEAATLAGLTRASQRWSHLQDHPNPVGWVIEAGLAHADTTTRNRPPTSVNRATGGYVRGLGLKDAIDALPLYQRAALVTTYYLGWTEDFTAAGFEVPVSTLMTRRQRAASFVAHHLRLAETEVDGLLREHMRTMDQGLQPAVQGAPVVRRRGRRRTALNRAVAVFVVVAVIVAGGALFQAGNDGVVDAGPQAVVGPRTSSAWFEPVSDGRGGFVALNTSGSAKFVKSSDGAEWFEAATWNSRAVDLRAEVTGFSRTGGRYLAVIEPIGAITDFVAPRIATSRNLRDWNVRQLEVEPPSAVAGLRRSYTVIASASSGEQVLVAIETTELLDHRSFDVGAEDVCGELVRADELSFFLCDDETVIIASLDEQLDGQQASDTDFFLADDGESFRQVVLPANSSPRSLIGFGGGFAVVDANQGQVWVSPNGVDWERATTSASPNRLVLLEGHERGALVIEPDAIGWASRVVSPMGIGASGDIPLAVAPEGIWSQPDVASGPAGWALFVTTSRPWERNGDTAGWAVATASWIVSRLPDADTITAQSVPDGSTLRLAVDGPWVQTLADGTIELRNPQDNAVLVEVTEEQIVQSRPTALDESRVKAQVFFSPDGVSWSSVWSSTDDVWSGSVAVGDDEILLSGTQLTGGPITIALGGSG